jgi:hypothetical protein
MSDEFQETMRDVQAHMDTLRNLESGDYDNAANAAESKARKAVEKIPIVGDRIARVGERRSAVAHLKAGKKVIQDMHEELEEYREDLGQYIDEQQDARQEAFEEYKQVREERQATADELEAVRDEYDELLGDLVAVGELDPVTAVQAGLSEDEVEEYAEMDVDGDEMLEQYEDADSLLELEEQRITMEDEQVRPLQQKLGRLSSQEKRKERRYESAQMHLRQAKETKTNADRWNQMMLDYENELEDAVEGQVVTGKVMEQSTEIATFTEEFKGFLRETTKARADQVAALNRATSEVWDENPIDEETAQYVEEKMDEAERARREQDKESYEEVTNEEQ